MAVYILLLAVISFTPPGEQAKCYIDFLKAFYSVATVSKFDTIFTPF